MYDVNGTMDTEVELGRGAMPYYPREVTAADAAAPPIEPGSIDFARRILSAAWHPTDPCVAVAGLDKLYMYSLSESTLGGQASMDELGLSFV